MEKCQTHMRKRQVVYIVDSQNRVPKRDVTHTPFSPLSVVQITPSSLFKFVCGNSTFRTINSQMLILHNNYNKKEKKKRKNKQTNKQTKKIFFKAQPTTLKQKSSSQHPYRIFFHGQEESIIQHFLTRSPAYNCNLLALQMTEVVLRLQIYVLIHHHSM